MTRPVQRRINPYSSVRQGNLRSQMIQALIALGILLALFLTRPGVSRFEMTSLSAPRPPIVQWTLLGKQWSPGG